MLPRRALRLRPTSASVGPIESQPETNPQRYPQGYPPKCPPLYPPWTGKNRCRRARLPVPRIVSPLSCYEPPFVTQSSCYEPRASCRRPAATSLAS